jgi:hypothetical protein
MILALATSSGCVEPIDDPVAHVGTDDSAIPTGDLQEQLVDLSLPSGLYQIRGRQSNKCLDVLGWRQENGAAVGLWDCNQAFNQRFSVTKLSSGYYQIQALHSGRCLDVLGWHPEDGAAIGQWDCNQAFNQQWATNRVTPGNYWFVSTRFTGKVFNIWGGSTANGARLVQYAWLWDATNEQFFFDPLPLP